MHPLTIVNIGFSLISWGEYKNWKKLGMNVCQSRQVNMADSCWVKILFIQKTSLQVQDIWKDVENFLIDCCLSWTHILFKNSYSKEFKKSKNRKRSGYIDR